MTPPLTLSLSKGEPYTLPPLWFDKPVLSKVEGLTMSGPQLFTALSPPEAGEESGFSGRYAPSE